MSEKIDAADILRGIEGLAQARLAYGIAPPPPPPPIPAPPAVKGLWYNEKIIKLDGWRFESCRFDKCRLIIETPNFSLVDCYLDSTNFIVVSGKLVNALQFMALGNEFDDSPEYHPIRNPNGTVTIGA
ncbi:hypothetical protein I5R92_06610 [Pseudomonas carnis]|uniref:hypothetical protein n=1 Tax=Pseudomonas TaxID=286 RepID=UPI001114F9B6|nr:MULTISPECIES: hypothetical protein [Pseudomonas]MBH3366952.1 hypothetical protein [Pseudomonas carnis]